MAGRKATVIGEVVKHTAARTKATCEISALGYTREDIDVNVLSPSKIPVSYRWVLMPTQGRISKLTRLWMPITVGIWFADTSGIQMVNMWPTAKWFVNWMVTWIADKKSGIWMWINHRHLRNIRPFSNWTFSPLFRSLFGYQADNWMVTTIQLTD